MSTSTRKSKSTVAGVVTLVGTAMLTTALPADAVQNYIATPLGSLGGTYWGVPASWASAINALGQVTGTAGIPSTPESSGSHAFIHANGAMIDLGTLGGQNSGGSAINDSGQVTGASNTGLTDLEGTVTHAFLYADGKMTDLGSLGGRGSGGTGINSEGQVVGWSSLHGYVTRRAFLYSGGSMTDLGTLGGAESEATGINDSGQVTGRALVRDVPWGDPPIEHAFLHSGGAMMDLGTLGGRSSWAYGINKAGQVTGASYIEGDTAVHAFLYSGGRMIDLGTLGGWSSTGTAINNKGQVTGFATTADDNRGNAFLYTEGKMYDLNSLVINDLGPGVVLRYANGINDRGQIAAVGCTIFVVIDRACQAYRLDPIASPSSANYQGLWWNAPAGSESGWGINFAHQGDTIFATWFTYDGAGEPWWLSMTANRTVSGTYEGTLLRTTGPAFNAIPFDPARVTRTPVGAGSLTFADANNGTFSYTLDGVFQVKAVTRQIWGPLPTCAWSSQPNLTAASNYQDLWWVANGAESGWGVNLTHQGDIIFATWFTYDFDGSVLWLSATLPKVDAGLYSGPLERTTGPPFNAQPFDPHRVTRTPVGTLTLKFSDGNTGTFTYSMYGVTQTKAITREVFDPPAATVCSDPPAASVTLDAPTTSPWAGELVQLMTVARDASGYVIPGKAATWASSDPRIATVSSAGVLQGLATGTVVVTATIDGVSDSKTLTVTPMPRISVSVGTAKEVVFRWATDRCDELDTPDLPAHAVKAEDGSLALFFGNAPRVYVNRGADFNPLKRDCSGPALSSADRRTPESYENWEWISAVYREGNRWHAFISNEFHDAIASTCDPGNPTSSNPCMYLSSTYAVSTDGARTFGKPMAPAHVVAPPPNVWKPPLPGETPNMGYQFYEGYGGPHSLVRRNDGFVYGVASVIPSHSEPAPYHPCLIRTDNLGDPASWRAWDGTGFSFRMVSPYILGGPAPICKFVAIPGFLITFNTYLDRFLYLGNFSGTMDGKPACGFYYSLSPDLFHWGPLQLVAAMRDDSVCPFDPQQSGLLERVPVLYPTVIDHADTTINFERPGRTPFLYYVRFNRGTTNDPLYWVDRDLVRVPLTFTRID